jgi:hypothetical protein
VRRKQKRNLQELRQGVKKCGHGDGKEALLGMMHHSSALPSKVLDQRHWKETLPNELF